MALPGSVTGDPGYTPDYQSLIQGDPLYQQAQAQASAYTARNLAQLQQALQAAIAQYGALPDLSKYGISSDIIAAITPLAQQLAQQNTANGLSTVARLGNAHQQNVLSLRNNLAARGMLESGALPTLQNKENLAYSQAQQDSLMQLLNAIAGYQNSFLQSKDSIDQALQQALQDAYQRESSLPQNQPRPAETYSYDVPSGTYTSPQFGTLKPFSAGGKWYLADGNGGARQLNDNGTLAAAPVPMDSLNSPLAPVAGSPSYATMASARIAGAPGSPFATGGSFPKPQPPAPVPAARSYQDWLDTYHGGSSQSTHFGGW